MNKTASKMSGLRGYRQIWLYGISCCSLIFCVPGWSQTQDLLDLNLDELLQLRITGSHISTFEGADSWTVVVIDREAIERSGVTSLEVLLQRLPISAGYAGNQTNTYWSGSIGPGTTHVNLRGLGINRTLVLLNGRRLAYGGAGANSAVDLNNIPLALVERVEVLKDGASAIYGADAIAGVVNIITRKSVEGVTVGLRYGEAFKHDGADYSADLAWGMNDERNSLMLSLSHSGNSAVNMATRAPCGLGESAGQLVCVDSGNTIGGRALLADGSRVNFNQILGGDPNFYEPYSAAKHNFNANPYLNAVNPIERTSLSAFGTSKLNAELTTFAELLYTERNSHQLVSPGTIGLNRPINISASQPTNPTGQDLLLQRRRLLEAGAREWNQDVTSFDGTLGLQGKLRDQWDWSMAIAMRRNASHDAEVNIANLDRVDQTLNTALCSNVPGAAIPCGSYLGYGKLTQPVIDYIMTTTRATGGNEQKDFSASLNGHLWTLPAGPVALATGVEIRNERGWRNPDPLVVQGIANTNKEDPVSGSYTAREVFSEVAVPLAAGQSWARSLNLNGALRYSDYGKLDSATNYSVKLDWQPVHSLQLHVNNATAFRAPNIPELYTVATHSNLVTTDPCSDWSSLPASSIVRQNCQLAGVPVSYHQLAPSILTTLGGNPDLKPETANTWSFGAMWDPISTMRLKVDFYRIAIRNAIGSIDGSTTLAACYNSPGLTSPLCSGAYFTRDATSGDINFLSTRQVNQASERMSGIDFGLQYKFHISDWAARFDGQVSNLQRYDVRAYPGADEIHYAGKITSGRGSYTHWRSFDTLTVERGPWSGSYSVQYIGGATDISAPPNTIGAKVPNVTYHNVQLQYGVTKSLRLAVGVDNLFDRSAPFVRDWLDANTDTMTYDLLGRRWYLALNYRL